jgi:dihydrofolate synthase/folylpolyglutamate synthase
MTYQQSLEFLFSLTNQGIKLGLENTQKFLKHVSADSPKAPIIHLAGTNGKGSTANMLHAIMQAHSLRSGLFTSPHINDFRERIRINKTFISEQVVTRFVKTYQSYILENKLTFFEVNTVLAVHHFVTELVDVIILETGLGGRLDATNCFKSQLCLLTPISMDHESYLGNSLPQIVREKAGIIKKNATVISSDPNTENLAQLKQHCSAVGGNWQSFNYNSALQIDIPLLGEHQNRNAQVALFSAEHFLGNVFNRNAAEKSLKTLNWHGRLERWQKNANVFLDVSHNPDGLQKTIDTLKTLYPKQEFVCLFAFLTDKSIANLIGILKQFTNDLHLYPLVHDRFNKTAYNTFIQQNELREYNLETPLDQLMGKNKHLLVIGSHFLLEQFHLDFADNKLV